MRLLSLLSLAIFFWIAPGCEKDELSEDNDSVQVVDDKSGRYDFTSPDAIFELPRVLEEVSGITLINDSTLVAIQDELGSLYFLDTATGKLRNSLKWGKPGDYEDVETVGDDVWVLRSDGTLFKLGGVASGQISSIDTFDTPLGSANDTEGLVYDENENKLLIACKESPGRGYSGNMRAIYSFDLETSQLDSTASYVLDLKEVDGVSSILGFKIQHFKPSAINIHPQTGELYIVSSAKKGIVTLKDGEVQEVINLPTAFFEQPEGLEFAENGDVFIANEGGGGSAVLLRFNRLNTEKARRFF